jgi:hypothetical protein
MRELDLSTRILREYHESNHQLKNGTIFNSFKCFLPINRPVITRIILMVNNYKDVLNLN